MPVPPVHATRSRPAPRQASPALRAPLSAQREPVQRDRADAPHPRPGAPAARRFAATFRPEAAMRIRPFRPLLALVALLAFASLIHAPPAHADFHLMKVVEVFGGTPAAPDAKYVVLQMYAANQGNLVNHKVTIFNA